jgi:hypothetical protein
MSRFDDEGQYIPTEYETREYKGLSCVDLLLTSPAILMPWPSGIVFSVQACGMLCTHPRLEGICIPLEEGDCLAPKLGHLHPGCSRDLITEAQADELDAAFRMCHVPIEVSREHLAASYEAWLYVRVLPDAPDWHALHAFAGREAFLSWQNCD